MKGIIILLSILFLQVETTMAQLYPKPIKKGKLVLSYANGQDSLTCNYKNWKPVGKMMIYYSDGKIRSIRELKNGNVSYLEEYYESGKLKRTEEYTYLPAFSVSGHLYDENGKEMDFVPYYEAPQYPGGTAEFTRLLAKSIQYPEEAFKLKKQGTVIIRCTISKDGYPQNVEIAKECTYEELNNEALRAVLFSVVSRRFTPGKHEGKPIDMSITFPVRFTLHNYNL